MQNYLLIFLLFSVFPLCAQNDTTETFYYDKYWQSCSPDTASFYRVIPIYEERKASYPVKEYYISGKIYSEGTYNNHQLYTKNGKFVWYFENGNKKKECQYLENELSGNYKTWYENGSQKEDGLYIKHSYEVNGEEKDINLFKVISYWDSTGAQKVSEGSGIYTHYNDFYKYYESGEVSNGLRTGIWKGQVEKFGLSFQDIYKNGLLISGESVDEDGTKYEYQEISIPAIPNGGYQSFYTFISTNLKYPKQARRRGTEGRVFVQFYIDTTGKIKEPHVIKGLGNGLDVESVRVVSLHPDWNPAYFRGKKVKQRIVLPITFKLN